MSLIPHAQFAFQPPSVPVALLPVEAFQDFPVLLIDTLPKLRRIVRKTAVPPELHTLLRIVDTVVFRSSHIHTDSQRVHSGHCHLGDHLVIMLLHLRILVVKSHDDNRTFHTGYGKGQKEYLPPVTGCHTVGIFHTAPLAVQPLRQPVS